MNVQFYNFHKCVRESDTYKENIIDVDILYFHKLAIR